MRASAFLENLQKLGIDNYIGVPDSQLKALCDILFKRYATGEKHVIAHNEGAAVAIAAGNYLATGHPSMVYMQNSGLGNALNPIVSLMDKRVYQIPCVFVIGWRGEPGTKDEPQHAFQGEITLNILDVLGIKYFIISSDDSDEKFKNDLLCAEHIIKKCESVAFVVRKNGLTADTSTEYINNNLINREDALDVIIKNSSEDDIFISTTGKASRELFELRTNYNQSHKNDFLTVGSMGHASMIAYAIAKQKKLKMIWCIDGDGAALMHLGSLSLIAKSTLTNFRHIIINNGSHESVGGMPVLDGTINFAQIGIAAGYSKAVRIHTMEELEICLSELKNYSGTALIEIMASISSRKDLGRPTSMPIENKDLFMSCLREK